MTVPSPARIPLGSSPRNHWRVSADTVDLTRPAMPPRPLHVAAEPQRLVLDAARTAMVVVDMQNDFCSPAGWLVRRGSVHDSRSTGKLAVAAAAVPMAAVLKNERREIMGGFYSK